MSINAVHQWFFRVDQLFKLVKLFRLYSVFYIGKGVKQLDFKHSQLERQKARVFPQVDVHGCCRNKNFFSVWGWGENWLLDVCVSSTIVTIK
jgi:hypothetical protein